MRKQKIVADENLLSFYKVGDVISLIESSMIESSSGHLLGSSADHSIIKGEIIVFTVNLSHMPLHDFYMP
jgi:hypothetical protein